MVRVSNGLITALNVLTLAVALSAMGFSLWFHVSGGSQCQRVMKTPLMVVSAALLLVSAAGLAGALTRVSLVMWLYLFMLFLLIIGLVAFTIFTVVVTNRGVGRAISGQGVGDHRLGNYSKWLQRYVANAKNWGRIKSCMADAGLCRLLVDAKKNDFYNPIASGCCRPPANCGMVSKNASYWITPKKGRTPPPAAAAEDPDCKRWSNDKEQMCLDCDSCKKAALANMRREWKTLALVNVAIVVFVIAVYSVGCCALRNNQYDEDDDRHPKPSHP